jgi:hypothetical protein
MPEWDHSETETSVDPRGLAPCMTIAHTGRTVGSYVCNKTFHYAEANLAAREHLKLYGRAALERRIQFTREFVDEPLDSNAGRHMDEGLSRS